VESWIKVKCGKRDAFPIVAFVEKLGAKPRKIASFYVARRVRDRLLYAGKVPGGFTEAEARDLRERLDPFIRKGSPLSEPVKKPKATWVEPVMEAEVAYSTLTENNLLREAVFKGVRQDQQSPALPAPLRGPSRAESSRRQSGVPRENILQLLPDAVAPSKEELAAYWKKIWKRALAHLGRRQRPESSGTSPRAPAGNPRRHETPRRAATSPGASGSRTPAPENCPDRDRNGGTAADSAGCRARR
jgi:bifunctional non-homologous end joining protein LigD